MKTNSNSIPAPVRICIALALLVPLSLYSQIALNGIVVKKPYEGSQPDLIGGVSGVPAVDKPLLRHVYVASPNVLALIIDEKALIPSKLKPYHPQDDDSITMGGYHKLNKILVRHGDPIGFLAGRKNEWYRPFNESVGEALDLDWISDPKMIRITSLEDASYGDGIHPVAVFRKTLPRERISRLNLSPIDQMTLRHFLYLELPHGLTPGRHYCINFENTDGKFQNEASFTFDDQDLRSEAIHVNLYGYQTADRKVAFLSSWMGDGGSAHFPEGLTFRVVRLADEQAAFEGVVKLRQLAEEPEYTVEDMDYNHNRADVWEMDFSSLQDPGCYKLVVDGIGCSFDFLVEDDIWENTSRLLMKGFLHQRAGIELGPPYTDYIRPRNMHPADGHTIHKLDPEIFFSADGGRFDQIRSSILEDSSIPEAWGGWMDAGDYDRRMTHLYTVRRMMYLCEMKPEYFEGINYNIPESRNSIPDILDEALWCLDMFRRTQGIYEEGAVSWQVESIEHPRYGETSWLNSLPTALLPPSPEACIEYVGTAAHMALLLREYDKDLAAKYEESALAAMQWVENNPDAPGCGWISPYDWRNRGAGKHARYHKDLAYLNLYRLTGDPKWHRYYQELLERIYPNGMIGYLASFEMESVSEYALMEPRLADGKLQEKCRAAIIELADAMLAGGAEATFQIPRLKNESIARLVSMQNRIMPIVTAHILTSDDKYTNALAGAIQYTMGSNPLNRSYVSGLGERSFTPYHHDWHADSLPLPAGLPNFGPASTTARDSISQTLSEDIISTINSKYGLYPAELRDWPMSEACFDQSWIWPLNEFMVETPMGELLLLTAYLAAE